MAHVPDSTEAHISRLSPDIQLAAWYLVYLVRSAGVPLQITSSLRTRSEQAQMVRIGASNTQKSHHLSGQAIDVDVHGYARDQIPQWWFEQLGQLGEQLGFRWGGRWSSPRDLGHFENPYWIA